MAGHLTLLPGTKAPALDVPLATGGRWSLAQQTVKKMVLIDFYRGVHCPRCKLHVIDLKNKLARFTDRGVTCLALSMDGKERGVKAYRDWQLDGMDLGYGLSEAQARAWGLYLTDAITDAEPRRFSEPATIMIAPDGAIYSAIYFTNPFSRIHFSDVLEGLDAMTARSYPARGTVD